MSTADTPMTPERWHRLESIIEAAAELDQETRESFLDAACQGDEDLRREAADLLASYTGSEDFLEPAEEPSDSDHPGDIGPYRVLHKLGEGGMGSVYAGERKDGYEKRVAIKVLHRGLGRLARRFRSERQILAHLEHPNIARLIDGGATKDGRPYFVMELVAGEPITDYCEQRRLDVSQRIEMFRKVCAAVHYAHRNMVVHRDIKPANILVDDSGTPKLLDFGIAKLLDPMAASETVEVTATGVRPLTPQYASPEQLLGQPITSSADIYSLGVLLYRLLTGRLPYVRRNDVISEIVRVLEEKDPSKPSDTVTHPTDSGSPRSHEEIAALRGANVEQLRRRLKGDLDAIVLKALRREPEQRYASAVEMAEDLRRHSEGLPVEARRGTLLYRAGKLIRRHRVAAAGLAAGLVMAVSFTVSTVRQAKQLEIQRDVAQVERDKARQVADFLVDIFRVADPDEARGRTITAGEILEKGAERLQHQLHDQPETQAMLLLTIGRVYHRLGLYDNGRAVLERSLELRRELLGGEHPQTAESLEALGLLMIDAGELDRARELLARGLEIRRQHPENALELASGHTHLANALISAGSEDEAEALLGDALALLERIPGVPATARAQNLHDLGIVHFRRGDFSGAEPLLREALELRQKALLPDHPELATSLHNLANVYEQRDELSAAEPLYQEALDIYVRTLGDSHPYVAASLAKLGAVKQSLGRFEEAEANLRRAREIFLQALGDPEHYMIGIAEHNLGYLFHEQAEFQAAVARFDLSVALMEKTFGDSHPWIATSLHYRGSSKHYLGDLEAAEVEVRRALEIRHSQLAEDHYHVALSRQLLGRVLAARGQDEEALRLLRGALELWEQRLRQRPENRKEIARLASGLVDLARFERSLGQEEQARDHLLRAIRHLQPIIADTEVARTLETHAVALLLMGRTQDARPSVQRLADVGWMQPEFRQLVAQAEHH